MEKEKKIELVFAEGPPDVKDPVKRGIGGKAVQQFATSIDEITNWFKQFEIESIELWISGGVETEGITRLFISAKGEGGLKVTLKPKS